MKSWLESVPLFPEAATEMAREIDRLYFFGLAVAVFFSALIALVVFYLAVRYRRRHADEVGRPEKAAMWLEVTWSVIPLAILLVMFAWGTRVFVDARRTPSDAVDYYVTAKQWMWKFQHPEGNREINHLHVPKGQTIQLIMTSEDVIHDFFVPAFRVKMDVLPGRYTTLWFRADRVGTFRMFCNEYCGVEHAQMGGSVIVMEPEDYERWLATSGTAPVAGPGGERLFVAKNCATCHKEEGGALGPSLAGLYGREEELADGSTVLADDTYLRESILYPSAKLVKGYQRLMPTYEGQLTEEELVELILYIKSLGDSSGSGAPAGSE